MSVPLIPGIDLPMVMYHNTPTKNVERIMRVGLLPSTRDKTLPPVKNIRPPRVYLAKTKPDAEWIKQWMGHDISTLVVTLRNQNIVFYQDPDFDGGVFTESLISREALRKEGA